MEKMKNEVRVKLNGTKITPKTICNPQEVEIEFCHFGSNYISIIDGETEIVLTQEQLHNALKMLDNLIGIEVSKRRFLKKRLRQIND